MIDLQLVAHGGGARVFDTASSPAIKSAHWQLHVRRTGARACLACLLKKMAGFVHRRNSLPPQFASSAGVDRSSPDLPEPVWQHHANTSYAIMEAGAQYEPTLHRRTSGLIMSGFLPRWLWPLSTRPCSCEMMSRRALARLSNVGWPRQVRN